RRLFCAPLPTRNATLKTTCAPTHLILHPARGAEAGLFAAGNRSGTSRGSRQTDSCAQACASFAPCARYPSAARDQSRPVRVVRLPLPAQGHRQCAHQVSAARDRPPVSVARPVRLLLSCAKHKLFRTFAFAVVQEVLDALYEFIAARQLAPPCCDAL